MRIKNKPFFQPNTADKATVKGTFGEDLIITTGPEVATLCPLPID